VKLFKTIAVVVFLLIPSVLFAEVKVKSAGFKWIDTTTYGSKFSWKIEIVSPEDMGRCSVFFSFLDNEDYEVYSFVKHVIVKKGTNRFRGTDRCKSNICDQMSFFEAGIGCREKDSKGILKKAI